LRFNRIVLNRPTHVLIFDLCFCASLLLGEKYIQGDQIEHKHFGLIIKDCIKTAYFRLKRILTSHLQEIKSHGRGGTRVSQAMAAMKDRYFKLVAVEAIEHLKTVLIETCQEMSVIDGLTSLMSHMLSDLAWETSAPAPTTPTRNRVTRESSSSASARSRVPAASSNRSMNTRGMGNTRRTR